MIILHCLWASHNKALWHIFFCKHGAPWRAEKVGVLTATSFDGAWRWAGHQRQWSEVLLRYSTPFTVLSASVEQKGYTYTKAVFSWLFCGPVERKPDFNCWTEMCGHHVEPGCKSLENFIIYQEVKQKFREAQFSAHSQCPCSFFFFFFFSRKSGNRMSNKQETPMPSC